MQNCRQPDYTGQDRRHDPQRATECGRNARLKPRPRPIAKVKRTPVPGDTITTIDVTRNSNGIGFPLAKRLRQHFVETLFDRITEQLQADLHALVSGLGLRDISAAEPVPNREIKTEIAVGLGTY